VVKRTPSPPDECANCGAALPRDAKSCPDCGADERTGWRDDDRTRYDGLDLPDSAFSDDSAPPASHPSRANAPRRVNGLPWYWWCVGLLLLVLLALSFLR